MILVSNPRSFLLIQTAFLGDVILATALIEKLRVFYPEAEIDFLVRKGNESVLTGHPFLRHVLVFDKRNKYRNLLKIITHLRNNKYDVVVNLQRFATSGLLTIFSGANETIGFNKNPFAAFFSKKVKHELNGKHEVQRNQLLISHLTDGDAVKPKLYPSSSDFQKIEPLSDKPFITIAPASIWFTKQWPSSKWKELIQKAVSQFSIYILGAPSDVALGNEIAAGFSTDKVLNLAGKLSLLQSAALMEKATMNFVNDSAPMHLASAMNAPVTAVYCSTVPEFGFGPLSDNRRIAEVMDLACRPCGLHGHRVCPLGHFHCAHQLDTEVVWNKGRF